ncbi:MAG: T3SS effector HopA1 family protein [Myxococcota bacterium]
MIGAATREARALRREPPLPLFGRIAAEVRLTSATTFDHRPATPPLGEPLAALAPDLPAPPRLPDGLSHFLYAHYYLQDPTEVDNGRTHALSRIPIRAREDVGFGLALRAANLGRGWADPGWTIVDRRDGGTFARKGGVTLFLSDGDIAGRDAAGGTVAVRFPNDRPYASPGFYTAIGDGGPTTPEAGPLVRVYFDVLPAHAPALLSALTSTLGASLSRFSVKLLNNPRWYTRPDAAVAWLLREEYPRARPVLGDIVRTLGDRIGERTPALARPVARGVAVAEEPTGDPSRPHPPSFGFHRCDLVATGLARAFAAGAADADARHAWILRELVAAGLDPARPWLNPGSADFAPLHPEETP